MPLSTPQVRNGIVLELAEYLKRREVDFERLRIEVGMERLLSDDPKQGVPLNAVVDLFDRAATALGDPCLGIRFAGAMRLGASGLIGHLVLNAPTIRDAWNCIAVYFPVFVTGMSMEVAATGDGLQWSWAYPAEITAPRLQFNMFMVAATVFRVRRAAGPEWSPTSVSLEGEPPVWSDSLAGVFGARVTFRANRNCLELDAACLSRPMPKADPQLYQLFRELADKWLKEGVNAPGIVTAVRNQLLGHLRSGDVDLEQVAKRLGISGRALQWRLDQAGTTFEKVRNETRQMLAEYYLRETDRPLVEIAHELGFSEQSAFTRAAQRWFGKSPRRYRRLYRENDAA